jgi:hypothetical protein
MRQRETCRRGAPAVRPTPNIPFTAPLQVQERPNFPPRYGDVRRRSAAAVHVVEQDPPPPEDATLAESVQSTENETGDV